jgi:hypothetical protein
MSVQFGRWNFDGSAVEQTYLDKVRAIVAPYATGGSNSYIANGIGIGY